MLSPNESRSIFVGRSIPDEHRQRVRAARWAGRTQYARVAILIVEDIRFENRMIDRSGLYEIARLSVPNIWARELFARRPLQIETPHAIEYVDPDHSDHAAEESYSDTDTFNPSRELCEMMATALSERLPSRSRNAAISRLLVQFLKDFLTSWSLYLQDGVVENKQVSIDGRFTTEVEYAVYTYFLDRGYVISVQGAGKVIPQISRELRRYLGRFGSWKGPWGNLELVKGNIELNAPPPKSFDLWPGEEWNP